MYVCPYCDAEINTSTEICPHCGADLSASGQPATPAPPKSTRSILIRWGILLGIIGIGLWGFLWYVMPSQHSDAARDAEARVVSALNGLHGALISYSAGRSGRVISKFAGAAGKSRARCFAICSERRLSDSIFAGSAAVGMAQFGVTFCRPVRGNSRLSKFLYG